MQQPTVILNVGLNKGKVTFRLQIKEMRGRGKAAQVLVDREPSKGEAIRVLLERAAGWSARDKMIIKDKAYRLMWDTPWPLTPEWLADHKGTYRL